MMIRVKGLLPLLILIFTACAGISDRPSVEEEFERGLSLFQKGEYASAISHFSRATEMEPAHAKAHLYLGRSLLKLGRWREAVRPLRTALRLAPDEMKGEVINVLVDALSGAADRALKKGDIGLAVSLLKEALEIAPHAERIIPELVKALIEYGKKLLREGDWNEAILSFSQALDLSPDDLDAYVGLAEAFLRNGDVLKALETVRKALRIDPENQDARSLLMDLLR